MASGWHSPLCTTAPSVMPGRSGGKADFAAEMTDWSNGNRGFGGRGSGVGMDIVAVNEAN